MKILAQLFTAAGNVLRVAGAGFQCGHEPVHTSASGTCVRLDPDNGQWYCFSCQKGGGPVEALMSLEGISRQDAEQQLKDPLGQPSEAEDKRTIADRLIETALGKAQFFHDEYHNGFAIISVGGHQETVPVLNRSFKRWLGYHYYLAQKKSPNAEALAQATLTLDGKAVYEGPMQPLAWRLTWQDGRILYDLTDAAWNVVTITAEGWTVANTPGVFRRGANAAPQVMPQRGGRLQDLAQFFPPMSEADRLLSLIYPVICMIPHIDHPIPTVSGDHGAAKSTLGELWRRLIDPAHAPLLSLHPDERELALTLAHNYMPVFDNLDGLQPWQSNLLCRACTGGGISKRTLYSDDDETVLKFWHCIVLNGITIGATRPDLLDRTLPLHLTRLTKRQYQRKEKFWAKFEAARPGILGGLLATVAEAMRIYPSVDLPQIPRMGDFVYWGYAAAEALEKGQGEAFLDAYQKATETQNDAALDSHAVATAIVALLGGRDTIAEQQEDYLFWEGTATELLTALEQKAEEHKLDRKAKSWPKAPNALSRRLREVRVNLLAIGVRVTFDPSGTDRKIALHKNSENIVNIVSTEEDQEIQQDGADDTVDDSVAGDPHIVHASDDIAPEVLNIVQDTAGANSLQNNALDDTDDTDDIFPTLPEGPPIEVGEPEGPPIVYVTTAAQLEAVLPVLCNAPVLGVDTETTGLDPRSDRLRLIQFALEEGVVVVDAFACPVPLLAPVFSARHLLTFHHAKFDLGFLHAAGLPWPESPLFDTQLAALLLGAGTADGTLKQASLDLVAQRYLGKPLDKTLQTSNWGGSLTPAQLAYAAADAVATLHLTPVLQAALQDARLTQVAAIECCCVPALTWLEACGVPLDAERWQDRAVREAHQAEALEAQLCASLLASRGSSGLLLAEAVNWQSQAQVLDLLRARGHTLDNTDSATLGALAADPLVPLLLDFREATKRAGTYGVSWLEQAVHPLTGRVHADYKQLGSAAGRMSCTKPNMQNLPRSAAYRGCITADEGSCIIKADYSQIELRIAAVVAQDPVLLAAYRGGEDLHVTTAARLGGVSTDAVTAEARQLAKAVNFGLIYGMGARRLQGYAQDTFRVTMTETEAQHYRQLFFDAYPGVRAWHRTTGATEPTETRTLTGRRRRGVTSFTQRLNTPVQGTGADGMKWALARLFTHRHEAPDAQLLLAVHDELVVSCPIEAAAETEAWLTRHMEQAMQEIVGDAVPTPVETTIGQDWAGTPLST